MGENDKITFTDQILEATFLKIIPRTITPNQVTIFRFLTVPFVFWLIFTERYLSGIILFAISAFTDALDGAMARTRNQITDWGKTYDPVADKLLIGLSAIVLLPKFLSHTVLFLVLGVEILIVASTFYLQGRADHVMQANLPGKIKMILQSFGVCLVMLYVITNRPALLIFSSYLFYISLVFAVISIFAYWAEYR